MQIEIAIFNQKFVAGIKNVTAVSFENDSKFVVYQGEAQLIGNFVQKSYFLKKCNQILAKNLTNSNKEPKN